MKSTRYLYILLTLTFGIYLYSCNMQFREKKYEDKYFSISIKKLSKNELYKVYKIENIGSLEFFLFSINYKKPTELDEGAGFLLDAIARLNIHKHGFDLQYKSFKIFDGFIIKEKSGINIIQYLVVFSLLDAEFSSQDIEKLNLQIKSDSNEKITDVIQFENRNEKEIMECNIQRKKDIEDSYLKKFPNGIPDFIFESLEYEIYMNQLSCSAVVKKKQ